MSDLDALVDVAARALETALIDDEDATWQEVARAALLAVGLPALLERVAVVETIWPLVHRLEHSANCGDHVDMDCDCGLTDLREALA